MQKISIQDAVWLYARFTLSYRDIEDFLAERGLDISYETFRHWFLKFGELISRNQRSNRPNPNDIWHLDEMVTDIHGKWHFLWVPSIVKGKFWISLYNQGEI